jgi:hypothetical protein
MYNTKSIVNDKCPERYKSKIIRKHLPAAN